MDAINTRKPLSGARMMRKFSGLSDDEPMLTPRARRVPEPHFYVPDTLSPRLPHQRFDPQLEAARVATRGLLVGRNRATGKNVRLHSDFLKSGVHFLGRTNTGKSFLMAWFFSLLAGERSSATIVLDAGKGSFFEMCKRVAISSGWSKRLVIMDLSHPTHHLAYDPMKPNGQPALIHSKSVRETIRAACNQSDFTQTAQLSRMLTIGLGVSRLFQMGLYEALTILQPGSQLRKFLLPKIPDPYLKSSLAYLDSLPLPRQDQLVASSLARLESFVLDPVLLPVLTHRDHSIDIGQIIDERKIFLVNLAKYDPLRKDDMQLFGRFLINDIVMKTYERFHHHRKNQSHKPLPPINLFVDEVQNIATFDLCDAIDEGREMGLRNFLAHQFLHQLRDEEKSGYLHDSMINDLRTKVIFNAAVEDLETLSKDLFLDRWSPWLLKQELTTLESRYIETTRASSTRGRSGSRGRAAAESEAKTEGVADSEGWGESEGEHLGRQETRSTATGRNRSRIEARGRAHTEAASEAHSTTEGDAHSRVFMTSQMSGAGAAVGAVDAHGAGSQEADASGMALSYDGVDSAAMMPQAMTLTSTHVGGTNTIDVAGTSAMASTMSAEGTSEGDVDTITHAESFSRGKARADAVSAVEAQSDGESESSALGHGLMIGSSRQSARNGAHTANFSTTQGATITESEEEGWNASETVSPFHEIHQRRVPSSQTPLSWEEFSLIQTQQGAAQGIAQCIVKAPAVPMVFTEAPWFEPPVVTERTSRRVDEKLHAEPGYFRVAGAEVDDEGADPQHSTPTLPALLAGSEATTERTTTDSDSSSAAASQASKPSSIWQ